MLDRWVGRIVVLLPAFGLLAGCKLIDQNTFAPSPEARPVAAAPAPAPATVDSRRALVTIDYAAGTPDYRQLLHYAVQAARPATAMCSSTFMRCCPTCPMRRPDSAMRTR